MHIFVYLGPYEIELTELLGNKHNIEPLVIIGNKGTILRNERATSSFTCKIKNTQNLTKANASISQESSIFEEPVTTMQELSPLTSTISNQRDAMSIQEQQHQITAERKFKKQMGTTARIIQTCQESIEKLTDRIQEEKHSKIEIERQVLAEYKQMRHLYEIHLYKMEEQLVIANKIRQERNDLLKKLLKKQNNNN